MNRNNTLLLVALCSTPILLSCQDQDVVPTGTINGYEYVDLGLSVRWATCNVGADSPEEYGDYYAWGETETKHLYLESNRRKLPMNIKDISGTYCDVAHVKWGGKWRMPTSEEFQELVDGCEWRRVTMNGKKILGITFGGVAGLMATSKKNGNSIFFPSAGCRRKWQRCLVGDVCNYWSSTLDTINYENAYYLYFDDMDVSEFYDLFGIDVTESTLKDKNLFFLDISSYDRWYGMPVRPVLE